MTNENLHKDALIIDGLVISKWSREVFADMREGGLTAANCTCSVWEGIRGSMDNIAAWKRMFEAHDDLILQVRTSDDIRRAK
ncbi:MAG: membrane dipeptidase, partial [Alphaproteobacteria bacterium]|nr:membrane dipeptidase [Alphaproteobacteria bacterium]